MSRLTRDGTAEPVSRDQILRHERGQGNIHFPCLADHEQDWQPYPVDPYSIYMCDYTYINILDVRPHLSVNMWTHQPGVAHINRTVLAVESIYLYRQLPSG